MKKLVQLGLILGELAIDWLTGKLEKKRAPARPPLPHVDSERQSKFAREAGKHGTVKARPN
jgi:hypothetical protein